jgi:hypothetical protein
MKIAFCISGEPRIFETQSSENFWNFKEALQNFDGIDLVHTYGHTWDHCADQISSENKSRLNGFYTSSLNEIREWLEADLNRLHFPMDKSVIALNNVDNLIEFSCEYWAQHFGFIKAMDSIPYDYDMIIRWRWDNITTDPDPTKAVKDLVSAFLEVSEKLYSFVLFCKTTSIKVSELASEPDIIAPLDQYFVMSKDFADNFRSRFQNGGNKKPFIFFEHIIQKLSKDMPPPRDHYLWYEMLRFKPHKKTVFTVMLDPLVTMDRLSGWSTTEVANTRKQKVIDQHEKNTRD